MLPPLLKPPLLLPPLLNLDEEILMLMVAFANYGGLQANRERRDRAGESTKRKDVPLSVLLLVRCLFILLGEGVALT